MPEQEISEEEKAEKEESGKEESKITMEDLATKINSQSELIESLLKDKENTQSVINGITEKYGLMNSDIQNLTNLLGNMSDNTNNDESYEDLTDPDKLDQHIDDRMQKASKKASDAKKAEEKAYYDNYVAEINAIFEEETMPDGKPYNMEAREGIKKILIANKDLGAVTKNGVRDAHKQFKIANKRFFGLDKTHGFKGGSLDGTGGGGSGQTGESKKVYKFTDEQKDFLKSIGKDEDWGSEAMEKGIARREAL